jgi:hypothetical protein
MPLAAMLLSASPPRRQAASATGNADIIFH